MAIKYIYVILDLADLFFLAIGLIGGILLILAGRYFKEENELNKGSLFRLSGILILISLTLQHLLPTIDFDQLTESDLPILGTYLLIKSISLSILTFCAWGLIFVLIGLKNSERSGKLLLISGIFFSISILINRYINVYQTIELIIKFREDIEGIMMISRTFLLISSIVSLLGAIFLLSFSRKINQTHLKVLGLFEVILGIYSVFSLASSLFLY